jgi:hypothetical protein
MVTQQNFLASIEVENKEFKVDNNEFYGVVFIIKLPINI